MEQWHDLKILKMNIQKDNVFKYVCHSSFARSSIGECVALFGIVLPCNVTKPQDAHPARRSRLHVDIKLLPRTKPSTRHRRRRSCPEAHRVLTHACNSLPPPPPPPPTTPTTTTTTTHHNNIYYYCYYQCFWEFMHLCATIHNICHRCFSIT